MTGRVSREDAYVTAYAALHEVVRRFLDDGANVRYLRRRHAEIEEDLTRLLGGATEGRFETSPVALRAALGRVRVELTLIVKALELSYPDADEEFYDAATSAQDGVAQLDDWLELELTANPPTEETR